MNRRGPDQRRIDDTAFPVRVKVRVPPTGFGQDLPAAHRWLSDELGPGDYAEHPAEMNGGSAVAFYFRRVEHAERFAAAFPQFEMADGTTAKGYSSPLFPRGRLSGSSVAPRGAGDGDRD